MAVDVDLITQEFLDAEREDWNIHISCILNVIFTILQEFGTRQNIFSTGKMYG